MRGKLIGVGVGPGDPELMTVKAIRAIKENDIIALPGSVAKETTAYKIAVQMVPELEDKELVALDFPMKMDREELDRYHQAGEKKLESILDTGKNVVFLTLGDVTVYSTFSYVQHYVEADGYEIELINGITSFCAAASVIGQPLVEWTEELHVIPAAHKPEAVLSQSGTYILMKSGKKIAKVKERIKASGRNAVMVENCGMDNEKRYFSLDEIPDDAGYFSLIIAKK